LFAVRANDAELRGRDLVVAPDALGRWSRDAINPLSNGYTTAARDFLGKFRGEGFETHRPQVLAFARAHGQRF
jgi:hypothetical protein